MAVALLVGGCGKPNHESLMRQLFLKTREFTGVLKDVKDEASAKAAAPKLKAIATDLQKLKKEADAMGPPSQEAKARLMAKLGADFTSMMQDLKQESRRVSSDPKLQAPLKEALDDFQKAQ